MMASGLPFATALLLLAAAGLLLTLGLITPARFAQATTAGAIALTLAAASTVLGGHNA